MGKIRKAIASISMVAVLSTLVMTTTAFAFVDVPADHWGFNYVEALKTSGAIKDATDFRPNDNIVRAEVAKITAEYLNLAGDTLGSSMFSDSVAGTWYDTYIGIMAQYGIMSGDQGKSTVRPGDNVNRAEVAKMLVEANGLLPAGFNASDIAPDVAVGAWYDEYMGTAYCYGLISGFQDGTFGPTRNATRVEFAKMAVKASEGVLIDACAGGGPTPPGPTPTGGDVSVSDASSPETMTIASNATSVGVLNFEVAAGTGGTTIESVTIKKSGVSSLASGFQAYLYEGTDRLTSGKSVNSESEEIYFTNLGLAVEAGKSRTFTLKVDIGDVTSSGEVKFAVTAMEAGESTVTGLPVAGNTMGLSTTDVGTITIDKDSSITNPKVGEQDVIVARFKLTSATEDALLEQFGLYFAGTIDTNAIQNLELYVSGVETPIATVAGVNSKEVASFVFDTPFTIIKGDTKSFTVKADLNTGRSADTLKAYVDENTDVVAIGAKYGYGMQVTRTGYDGTTIACTSTSGACSYSTLEGGDITISSNGPAATDVATNAKDVVLMNFNITAVSPVTFKNFEIALTAAESGVSSEGGLLNADGTANFTDIKIINTATGKTLMGPVDSSSFVTLTGGTVATGAGTDESQEFYKYTDEFDMTAGQNLSLALTADIKNDTDLQGATVIPALSITSTLPEVRDVNNKVVTNTTSIVPSSTITGKTMTVKSPTLTVALSSDPTSKTYVKGSKAVKFACFSMNASQASDIKITSLTLGSSFSADADAGYVTDGEDTVYLNAIVGAVKLVDGAGVEKVASKAVASDGTVTFSNMSYTVTAGATQLLCVQGDISADAYKDSNGEQVAFGITAAASITAEDKNGNSLATAQKVGLAVNGTPTTVVTVSGGGSLTVAVDPATAKEDIAVAGSTGVSVSKFKFTTTAEGFTVKKLSINNRQSAVTTAQLGDYDNNVSKVTLSYKDKAGTTKTAAGYLANGTANFSGLDMYIGKDSDEVLTVTADLNSIADGSAQAGEFVDLNLAFNDFEAVAEGSGETYKGDKIDATVAAASDLDFGSITWADGDAATDILISAAQGTAGVSFDLSVDDDDGADDQSEDTYPVGTLFCVDEGEGGSCGAAENILVVTAVYNCTAAATPNASCVDANEDIYTVTTLDDPSGAVATDEALLYALPGTGYLGNSNQMHVYESKPTVAVAASSPSGSRSTASSDNAFVFTVAANAMEKVQFRTAKELATCAIGFDVGNDGDQTVSAAESTVTIDGTGCKLTQVASSTADDTISFDAGAVSTINQYARASFWVRSDVAPEFADIQYGTDAAAGGGATGAIDNVATLAYTNCTLNGATTTTATLAASTWYFCDVAVPSATTTERYFHIATHEITELANTKFLYIDRLVLYNDKIEMDLTGDDIDTQANGAHGLVAYLKDGGSTVATGYVAKNSQASAEGGAAKVVFYPIDGTDAAIEVSKGTSKDFTVQLNTGTLLAEDAGADDPLTFSMDLGTSTGGTVTAGDVWWNDTNYSSSTAGAAPGTSYALTTPGIIKWLGQVASTTLSGATVKY